MRSALHQHLPRFGLVAFLAADLLGLSALLYDQWFAVDAPQAWLFAAVLTVCALPLLFRAADAVMVMAQDVASGQITGEKIP
jgi:hypothetical protein